MEMIELHPVMLAAVVAVVPVVEAVRRYFLISVSADVEKRLLPLVVLLAVGVFAALLLPVDLGWRTIALNVLLGWTNVMGIFSGTKALVGKS